MGKRANGLERSNTSLRASNPRQRKHQSGRLYLSEYLVICLETKPTRETIYDLSKFALIEGRFPVYGVMITLPKLKVYWNS